MVTQDRIKPLFPPTRGVRHCQLTSTARTCCRKVVLAHALFLSLSPSGRNSTRVSEQLHAKLHFNLNDNFGNVILQCHLPPALHHATGLGLLRACVCACVRVCGLP